LLEHLAALGLDLAPRYLGVDELGRETFTYLEGDVPDELDDRFDDRTLVAAGRLVRRFHDATAGSALAEGREVVCHNDLSPCNFVFRSGEPVALIDFDAAAPGQRLDDLGYALFLWLNLGTDGPGAVEQARRISVFSQAYGVSAGADIVSAIVAAVAANIERLRADSRFADIEWWQAQLDWINEHRAALTSERAPG
jgi:aminoglycoside phosphotransferase (APT) family kinase protein